MADNTKIEWCDATFNPWTGCTKVSPACDHCYAESWAKRSGIVKWGAHPRRRTSEDYWRQPLNWNRKAERDGVRRKVFCCSLADVFDNQVDPQWRTDLWALIDSTPNLDWLLLTKRPQNIAKMLPAHTGREWPYPNVWLGTTVENQEEADRRIPHLLAVPAAKHFLSCEPLLGPVRLPAQDTYWPPIDWVIAGGESGPGARPSHPDWFRSLRDQCAAAGVPYFHKQNGEYVPCPSRDDLPGRPQMVQAGDIFMTRAGVYAPVNSNLGSHLEQDGAPIRRVGKKAAGALLDGVEHKAMPRA